MKWSRVGGQYLGRREGGVRDRPSAERLSVMRILVVSLSTYSSAENRAKLESLARRVDRLTAVSADISTMWGASVPPVSETGYEFHLLEARAGWAGPGFVTLRRLAGVVAQAEPHAVHIEAEPWQAVTLQTLALARRRGVPVGVQFAETGPQMGGPSGRLRAAVARRVLRRCDYAIGWSRGSARLASVLAPDIRVLTMPGTGYEPVQSLSGAPSGSESRCRWFGNRLAGSYAVSFIGRLAREKGVHDLMLACDELSRRLDIRVAIVGIGPLEHYVRIWARTRPWVHVHGLVSRREAIQCAANSDLVLIPSRSTRKEREQFGKTAMEAMAVGTPVVCYACGALPEVVGSGGTVVPEGDLNGLVAAAEASLKQSVLERRCLAVRAKARAADFSSERLAEGLVSLWSDLLQRCLPQDCAGNRAL